MAPRLSLLCGWTSRGSWWCVDCEGDLCTLGPPVWVGGRGRIPHHPNWDLMRLCKVDIFAQFPGWMLSHYLLISSPQRVKTHLRPGRNRLPRLNTSNILVQGSFCSEA